VSAKHSAKGPISRNFHGKLPILRKAVHFAVRIEAQNREIGWHDDDGKRSLTIYLAIWTEL